VTEIAPQLVMRKMTMDDLPAVMEIDRLSFSTPWSPRSFDYELNDNPASCLRVAEVRTSAPGIAGFAGFWMLIDEAHISTLAVHPDLRGRGIGGVLLRDVIEQAIGLQASLVTLEVRESNQVGIHLYRNHGFEVVGRRVRYYKDNQEDAILMTLTDLRGMMASDGGVV
jgi:ribosomal-protein-alanine N-acetyltransferase